MQQKIVSDIQLEFRIRLQDEFSRRCRVNSRYSIRAFAKLLKLDSSALSQILCGKRRVSEKFMAKIDKILGHYPQDSQLRLNNLYTFVEADVFSIISDWYHFAILDLTLLKNFKSDVKWIASQLSITVSEAQIAIERLKRAGMLVEKKSKLIKAKSHYNNFVGASSSAHKEYQRQLIQKALQSVDMTPPELKDITAITIAGNSKKIAAVSERITKFRREICNFMEDGQGDAVFHLTVQLYPVTKVLNK